MAKNDTESVLRLVLLRRILVDPIKDVIMKEGMLKSNGSEEERAACTSLDNSLGTEPTIFEEVITQSMEQGKLQKEQQKNQEEMSVLRKRITLLRDRLSEIEIVSGNILWKISSFNKKVSEATRNYTMIRSQPFYLEGLHYKACLEMHPNGKGIGKGNHMSLLFVIMKGEFDNILQWPFTHKVTFKLINQTGGRDIIDTFQPDPIKRPEQEAGNGSGGCLQFVSHSELKERGFVEDDTVFIQCKVI